MPFPIPTTAELRSWLWSTLPYRSHNGGCRDMACGSQPRESCVATRQACKRRVQTYEEVRQAINAGQGNRCECGQRVNTTCRVSPCMQKDTNTRYYVYLAIHPQACRPRRPLGPRKPTCDVSAAAPRQTSATAGIHRRKGTAGSTAVLGMGVHPCTWQYIPAPPTAGRPRTSSSLHIARMHTAAAWAQASGPPTTCTRKPRLPAPLSLHGRVLCEHTDCGHKQASTGLTCSGSGCHQSHTG